MRLLERLALLYALCIFLSLCAYIEGQGLGPRLVSLLLFVPMAQAALLFNLGNAVCNALGLLAFALTFRNRSIRRRQLRLAVAFLCTGAAMAFLELATPYYDYAPLPGYAFFWTSFGYLQGLVLYQIVKNLKRTLLGRFIGVGTSLAVAAQLCVIHLDGDDTLRYYLRICAISAFLVMAAMVYTWPRQTSPVTQLPLKNQNRSFRNNLSYLIAPVTLIALLRGLDQGLVVHLIYVEGVDFVYSSSRLMLALSLPLAGYLYDRWRAYRPLAVLIAMTAELFSLEMFDNSFAPMIKIGLTEICEGFILVYLLVIFLDFAADSLRPELWCCLSLTIYLPVMAAGGVISDLILQAYTSLTVIGLYMVCLLGLVILIFHGSQGYLYAKQAEYNAKLYEQEHKLRLNAEDESAHQAQEVKRLQQSYAQAVLTPAVRTATGGESEADAAADVNTAGLESVKPIDSRAQQVTEFVTKYQLSQREVQVLNEILQFHDIRESAQNLFISERTVKYHISNILQKCSLRSQREIHKLFAQEQT